MAILVLRVVVVSRGHQALGEHMAETVIDLDEARRLKAGNEPWMTKRQLADALGFSVRWIEYRVREQMPHKRIGGRLRFQRSVVEAWLDEREQTA